MVKSGAVADPEGNTWSLATRKENLSRAELGQRAQDNFAKMARASR